VGGSRGARSINGAVDAAIPLVAAHVRVTWLWQTGRLDHE
jgi:UDP-N-acetylglucosamine:LPS N-acetylglucosamine transferase